MTRRQPADEWEFLPDDDRLTERVGLSPEALALHLVDDPHDVLPAEDPGRAEVALDDEVDVTGGIDADVPVAVFDDEQPVGLPPWGDADDDVEPDLEQLLESQHYAFAPDEG